MADCTLCGTRDAYNSGFSLECINPSCKFYSPAHQKACLGSAPSFKLVEATRKATTATPEMVQTLRISSKTTPVRCEICYSADGGSFSFERWRSDSVFEYRVNGAVFSATVEAVDTQATHSILIELLSVEGATLFSKLVDFDSKNLTFQVNSD